MFVLEGRARGADLVAATRGDSSQAAFGRGSLRSQGQLVGRRGSFAGTQPGRATDAELSFGRCKRVE